MGVEAIHHQMPLSRLGVSGNQGFEVGKIVRFGARIANLALTMRPVAESVLIFV
jgi:hypothetical protein